MNVGAHLVDMSPLSTTGAMCLAGITNAEDVRPTTTTAGVGTVDDVIGAMLCWLMF
jgi:hypothetical protein